MTRLVYTSSGVWGAWSVLQGAKPVLTLFWVTTCNVKSKINMLWQEKQRCTDPRWLNFEGKFPGNYFEKFEDEKFCRMWKKEAY